MNLIDKAFGLSPQVLTLRARRTEVIAANLANADTPGYKARDIDFREALASARGSLEPGRMNRTNERHIAGTGGTDSPAVKFRIPMQPSLDGNTVEADTEHMAFMDNAIRYQASLNFLDGRLRGLLLAMRGE